MHRRSAIQSRLPEHYQQRQQTALTPEARADIIEFENRFAASQKQLLLQQVNHLIRAQNLLQLQQQPREAGQWNDPKTWLGLVIIATAAIVVKLSN